jgi:predicted Zn finger-like uncharacterized protein
MQLTCPNCGARYRIDASDWPTEPGLEDEPVFRPRRARCKVCRSVWSALPEEEVLELDDPLPPDEEHPRLADAAWASVGGWPDPRPLVPPPAAQPDFSPPLDRPPPVFTPPGFTPPKDPSSPLFAPPARPSIHFEAPPIPIPAPEQPGVRARLPGPGALVQVPAEEPAEDVEADRTRFADPAPEADDSDAEPDSWEAEEDEPKARLWPWIGAFVLAALGLWTVLVLTGRVQPENYGLPRYNPTAIGLPAIDVPSVSLPRAPLPPLGLEAEAVRRQLPGNRQVWEIAGTIINPTNGALPVPPVEILLLDSKGAVVGRWTVRPEAADVGPGKAVRFETSAIDPPAGAVRLRMQLKPAELGRL